MSKSLSLTLGFEGLPKEAAGCDGCLDRVEDRLRLVGGVEDVEIVRERRAVKVRLSPQADAARIEQAARKIMSEIASGYGHDALRVGGMDCPACAKQIELGLRKLPGVLSCKVDFQSARMSVEFDKREVDREAIQREVRQLGYSAQPLFSVDAESTLKSELWMLVVGGALYLAGLLAPVPHAISDALFAAAGLVSGWRMILAGLYALTRLNFTMNALMTVAVIGAAAIHEWEEAAMVAWLFLLGSTLQASANRRTRSALKALMEDTPKLARLKSDGMVREIDVREVVPGDLVEVKPYETVPIDGEVVEGESSVNNSALTGESEPQFAGVGSRVLAGGMNEGGLIMVRALKAFADTTYAKVLELIEQGESQRSRQQELIERFSAWYTPTVIVLAILYGTLLPILGARSWNEGLHQAFWLLMVACPCALVISTPVAVVAAIGGASRRGALVKGGIYLEALARVKEWVFDKTGTLSHARLEVVSIEPAEGISETEALKLAAGLAQHSGHPVSRAIFRRASEMQIPSASDVKVTPARGVEGAVEGRRLRLGSAEFSGVSDSVGSAAFLTENGHLIARFVLADKLKPEAVLTVQMLKKHGANITLLSGDKEPTVERFARELGVSEFKSNLSPAQKAEIVEEIKRRGPTGVVGDGINDVAALQRADVGIAMGAAGSESAVGAADIVLLNDDISNVPKLISLSKRYHAVLIQNIGFSLVTKGALLVAGAIVVLPFWVAVVGDMGVSLLVTLNAMRLRKS